MNVNVFANNPPLKWFFIAAVLMLLTVLLIMFIVRIFTCRVQAQSVELYLQLA